LPCRRSEGGVEVKKREKTTWKKKRGAVRKLGERLLPKTKGNTDFVNQGEPRERKHSELR